MAVKGGWVYTWGEIGEGEETGLCVTQPMFLAQWLSSLLRNRGGSATGQERSFISHSPSAQTETSHTLEGCYVLRTRHRASQGHSQGVHIGLPVDDTGIFFG